MDMFLEELKVEEKYQNLGREAMKKALEKAVANKEITSTLLGQNYSKHGLQDVIPALSIWLETVQVPKRGVKPVYTALVMECLKVYAGNTTEFINLLAFASMSNMLDSLTKGEGTLSRLGKQISKAVLSEVNLQKYLNENKQKLKLVEKELDKRVGESYRRRYAQAWYKRDNFTEITASSVELSALGVFLVDVVMKNCSYFEYCTQDTICSIRPTDAFMENFKKNSETAILNAYKTCPMVIQPGAWTAQDEGGYLGELQSVSTFLRLHYNQTSVFARNYKDRMAQMNLEDVQAAVNGIQNTPWKINTKVLEVMQALVELGGDVAGIPSINPPPKPVVLPEQPTEEQIKHYRTVMADYYKDETTRKSLVLRALSNIRMADDFKKYDKIYFPCNCDFRGRVYPIPSFSFQGDDLTKSLLLFADVPECQDEQAIEWLMVHGANLAGVDKVSFADRKKWVLDNEEAILACAENPLNNRFWAAQDSPCQFLTFCFEWQAWKNYKQEHGTAKGFKTGIPVAFDGTCSGLQHFSAILRDTVGGKAVNLLPTDKPSDIYQIVADKVNVALKEAAVAGTLDKWNEDKNRMDYGTKSLAQLWLAFGVTRKVTKRSVMTLAYGSKQYGFRDQLMSDTIKPDMRAQKEASIFTKNNNFQAAGYLAKLIWEAVQTTVVKAVEGMKWLQDCANKVTKAGQVVTWTTPMGLPVQQAYMVNNSVSIRLQIASRRIRVYTTEPTGNIDKRAQTQGIAPNFIHSMDASHLQLTTVNAMKAGIHHFAMIHDSYGAPVAQAQLMFDTVRQSFYQMYTEHDILAELKEEFSSLTDETLPDLPKKGELDITCVLNSNYIFC